MVIVSGTEIPGLRLRVGRCDGETRSSSRQTRGVEEDENERIHDGIPDDQHSGQGNVSDDHSGRRRRIGARRYHGSICGRNTIQVRKRDGTETREK